LRGKAALASQTFEHPRQERMAGQTRRLRRPQSLVAKYETGERRLDIVELLEVAEAIGFDTRKLVAELIKIRPG
jgi:hypothetical protein